MKFRALTPNEITLLTQQGCQADDWSEVIVSEDFTPSQIFNSRFAGRVIISHLSGKIQVSEGLEKTCGIYDSYINNCEIGRHSYISNVDNLVSYRLEDNVCIENVGSLMVHGKTAFGNGTTIDVLNEGGGRELPLFDRLSAPLAYLMVNYRHDNDLVEALDQLISKYVQSKNESTGLIKTGARVLNCGIIKNVHIGASAIINGANLLKEGTIQSNSDDPVYIGEGVIAKHFIVLSGAQVDGGALIDHSLVGQGTRIGKQYSMENSLFFANSEGFHGEAVSVFGGPYTVTHHKSTLLIAGMFSFYNAGSGTNQSNHMYKLGPLHQGIVERGAKTGSFSYLLWPCRVGAFSVVTDKHSSNFDTSDFPFSYVTVDHGKSMLTPAMNLFTVGTKRDSEKWPNRDRRKDPDKLDLINFDLFNPNIIGKVLTAIEVLGELYEKTPKEQEALNYKGIRIKRLMLKTCRKYYQMIIPIFIGDQLVAKLREGDLKSKSDLASMMTSNKKVRGQWLDLAGLVVAGDSLQDLYEDIKGEKVKNIADLEESLIDIFNNYENHKWNWTIQMIVDYYRLENNGLDAAMVIKLLNEWKINSVKLNNMILKDAQKEFDASSKIGFGVDGDENIREKDFEAVRGSYESNKFVKQVVEDSMEIEKQAHDLIEMVEKLA